MLSALATQKQDQASTNAAWEQLGQEEEVAYKEVRDRFKPRWRALEDDTEGIAGTRDAFDELEEEEAQAIASMDERFDTRNDALEAADGRFYFLSQVFLFGPEPLHVTRRDSHGPRGTLTEVTSFASRASLARRASVHGQPGDFFLGISNAGFEDLSTHWYHADDEEQARQAAFEWAAIGTLPLLTEIPSIEGQASLTQIQDDIIPF